MGSLLKTAPVVKEESDRQRLWQGLESGELSFVATDHAAARWPDEKETGSIWTDYGGVPGVELLLPYLFSEGVVAGRITLQRLTELLCSEPARFFGVDHRKGRLRPGRRRRFRGLRRRRPLDRQGRRSPQPQPVHTIRGFRTDRPGACNLRARPVRLRTATRGHRVLCPGRHR